MSRSNKQMKRNISISIDNVEDIILPRLNTLSPAQWTLLSQGLKDSHITGVLADILSEIFQQCVENSLKIVVPMIEENMEACAKTEIPDENISVNLNSLITAEMATALQVSPEICHSGEELNSLMEEEVSQKVTSIANVIIRTPVYPVEPAVYVSARFSSLINLNRMVSNAVEFLRKHLNRARSSCADRYWSRFVKKRASSVPPPKPETAFELPPKSVSSVVKHPSFLALVGEGITKIIEKHSHDSYDAKKADDVTEFCPAVQVAEAISQTIIEDLHFCKSEGSVRQKYEKSSCAPHFNLKKIVGDIRSLFSSKLKPAPAGRQQITSKPEFSSFVKQRFSSMVSSLKKSLDSSDTKVVKLKHDPGRSSRLVCLMCPGCVPEVSSDEESPKHRDYTETDHIPKLDFQSIKPQIDSLCAESTENTFLNDKIKQFAKELTDTLYVNIMRSHYYQIPVPPEGKCLSDSVLSSKKIRDASGQIQVCPEVFYARAEDEVRTFLQRIFLWIKNEETYQISEEDKVSSVLSEINDLVKQICVTSTQIMSPEPCEPQNEKDSKPNISREFADKSKSDEADQSKYDEADKSKSDEADQVSLTSDIESWIVTREKFLKKISTSDGFTASGNIYFSCNDEIQTNMSNQEAIESDVSENTEREEGNTFLVMSAALNCSKKNGGPFTSKEMGMILCHLSGVDDVEKDFTVNIYNENTKQFVREITKDLKNEFGSTEAVLKAMMSEAGRPFKRAVLRFLKSYFNIKPPKSAVQRFFSAITKLFRNLFRKQRVSSSSL
ncbi:uncharacterized protein LOC124857398 [Girardinichthys multiradiatus]|uniref:uncharacterized protein LOC124857398 n=1 Tax=Girardinichthys multiradiatus TaxID=208333 RepID=UPI001FAE3544|nr:uncharacterized protein LOC124857398 [Girardinichthys multiradiatus]